MLTDVIFCDFSPFVPIVTSTNTTTYEWFATRNKNIFSFQPF